MAPEVLVINENGEQLGVLRIEEARRMAKNAQLDLVCVAPNAKTPVCRFMDYSKFRYEQQKKARESKKNQKIVTIKEIWLTPVISINDFETKLRAGRKFLEDGDKLKVTLRFNRRARMLSSDMDIQRNLDKFVEMTADIASAESKPSLEGKSISLILVPKKK
jgi:translation initiation factor IF-3